MAISIVTGVAGLWFSPCRSSVEPRELVIGIDQFNDYYDPNLKRRNIAQFENHPAFKLVEGMFSH